MNIDSKNNGSELSQKDLRKEREREAHRLAILKAAESVFAEKGFHGTTIEEIARRAGFAVGTLYNFFKNKDDLYASVIISHHEDITRRFDAIISAKSGPFITIGALLDLLLAHFKEHKPFVRIFFETNATLGTLPPEIMRFHTHYTDSLQAIFKQGVDSGEFVSLDPRFLTFWFEGFTSSIIRYLALNDFKDPLEEIMVKARETFETTLRSKKKPAP